MKSYIIRLSNHKQSRNWAKESYDSGKYYDWNINYFNGIDGKISSLDDYNIKVNTLYKKGIRLFRNPGVVGCFLSHYLLWKKCVKDNENICILEHDTIIYDKLPNIQFDDVLKLVKGPETKKMYLGEWWASGAAYCITPSGAKKIINFSETFGAMPADTMLNTGIAKIQFYSNKVVSVKKQKFSFTKDF